MVSCLMGDSTALASAIVRCCLMFIPENTYARNRKNPDAIVYLTTNGEICLTRDDFESEEEFLR